MIIRKIKRIYTTEWVDLEITDQMIESLSNEINSLKALKMPVNITKKVIADIWNGEENLGEEFDQLVDKNGWSDDTTVYDYIQGELNYRLTVYGDTSFDDFDVVDFEREVQE